MIRRWSHLNINTLNPNDHLRDRWRLRKTRDYVKLKRYSFYPTSFLIKQQSLWFLRTIDRNRYIWWVNWMVYSLRRISLYRFVNSWFSPFQSQFTFLHWKNRQEHFYSEMEETAAAAYLNPFCRNHLGLKNWPIISHTAVFLSGSSAYVDDDEEHLLGLTVLRRSSKLQWVSVEATEMNEILLTIQNFLFYRVLRLSTLYYNTLNLSVLHLIAKGAESSKSFHLSLIDISHDITALKELL